MIFSSFVHEDYQQWEIQKCGAESTGWRGRSPGITSMFSLSSRTAKYKPEKAIKELLSAKQTKYREIQFAEFMYDYKSKGSDGKPALPHFKRA